jgi:putative ABC transport system permease protein
MMLRFAWKMLLHKKARFAFTVLGLGTLFLLGAAQVGLLVGWCNTLTAVMAHCDADVWVMAKRTVAWDYGIPIPRHRVYQVRNVQGVAWGEGMYVGWSMWQRPDGRRVSVQVVGLDRGSVGGPWHMREGKVEDVHLPHSVIVDELFMDTLGVRRVGDQVDLADERATVRGICRGVRTFTASPFVFTAMKTAPRYDQTYKPEDTTFVLVRCRPGADPKQVARRIEAEVPSVEALTTEELMARSVGYWMGETGVGLIVLLTTALAVLVSAVVTSQTLFTITQDHLANYATLLAVGFSRRRMLGCVLAQGLVLSGLGVLLGGAAFHGLRLASAGTLVPLEMTPGLFAALVTVSVGCCLLGSFLSVKAVLRIDPVAVFRA